jgi:hypothetical protein
MFNYGFPKKQLTNGTMVQHSAKRRISKIRQIKAQVLGRSYNVGDLEQTNEPFYFGVFFPNISIAILLLNSVSIEHCFQFFYF